MHWAVIHQMKVSLKVPVSGGLGFLNHSTKMGRKLILDLMERVIVLPKIYVWWVEHTFENDVWQMFQIVFKNKSSV